MNYEWLEQIPKVELHVHLEGAIPLDALWELVQKYGGDPSCPSRDALQQRFEYRDFPHFIETWVWKNGFLREYDDFTFIAQAVAEAFASHNIQYAEAFYSPRDFARHGLQAGKLTEAIRAGLDRVSTVQVQLVADLIRDFGPELAAETLAEVSEVQQLGVVGIGIGGSEQAFPPEPFAEVYERARQLAFKTSAHAGEAAGAESVWGAIRALKVDRMASNVELVQIAAAIGREFRHDVLEAVTDVSQEELNDEIAMLVSSELLNQRGRPPHARYTFKHALIQDAAYDSLVRRKRQ